MGQVFLKCRIFLLVHPYLTLCLCVFQAVSGFRVDDLQGWAQIASDSPCPY